MEEKQKATLIVFSGEMDKVLASFVLATGAASMGMEVTMFFTFWGLNVIRKGGAKKTSGVMKKAFNLMNKGGADKLPLSRLHMAGLGTAMMKQLMKKDKVPSVPEFIVLAKTLGVKFIACTTSIAMMGLTQEDFIPEVDDFAGVTTYLSKAKDGRVNLFI